MKRTIIGVAALVALAFPVLAKEDLTAGFYGNTVIRYNPGVYERHSWYENDGNAVHFNGYLLPEGLIYLEAYESKWQPGEGKGMEDFGGDQFHPATVGWHWRAMPSSGPDTYLRVQFGVFPGHQ